MTAIAFPKISDSQIQDAQTCIHRVNLDLRGDEAQRGDDNAFVQMLWRNSVENYSKVLAQIGPHLNLSGLPDEERAEATLAAMARKEPMIYGGLLMTPSGSRAKPALLALEEDGGGYLPGKYKASGENTLPLPMVLALAHAVSLLGDLGFDAHPRRFFVIDRAGQKKTIPLDAKRGIASPQTWWDAYVEALPEVGAVVSGQAADTRPALGATCKLCPWYAHCKKVVVDSHDLSLLPELGRGKRDTLMDAFPTVDSLAAANLDNYIRGKKTIFPGIGIKTLEKFQERAQLMTSDSPSAYLKEPVHLPVAQREIAFDIEADPLTDIVYLHGFVERQHGRPETARFVPFFAESGDTESEEACFAGAWQYLKARLGDSIVYYYSQYEFTAYKALAEKYPQVCSVSEVEEAFSRPAMIDLYTDVVRSKTEWPLNDHSIKSIAVYLGFKWRDESPSGANSILWYSRWVATGDPALRDRILIYNEDDCFATMVVLDGVRRLPLKA